MPNSETAAESKSRKLTGSSKRKRKHSIKRNIILIDGTNSDNPPDPKTSKVERTYGKKVKAEKGKPAKDVNKSLRIGNKTAVDLLECKQEKKFSECQESYSKTENSEEKCKNLRSTDIGAGQCTFAKQQCQNCKFCSEHGEKKDDLGDSKEKQRNKKKFTCAICAKEGSTKVYNSLKKHNHHMATVHEIYSEEIKRFECTDCPDTVWFPTKSKFTYHLGTKHPGIMKFVCEVCTETFILKANYKTHMKTHNLVVQKKFSCDVCNGTFVNKAGFEAHKKRFPGPHIKQSCSHCGFSFSREKHMKNHRCKTLLLEAAARANKPLFTQQSLAVKVPDNPLKVPDEADIKPVVENIQMVIDKKATETTTETEPTKKLPERDPSANKRVVFHRIIPRRNQDQTVYRPVQMQAQNVSESVVVQELREIDLENGTYIATSANEPEPQFIVRDLNGHILQGNQILQLDINEAQQGDENQVYLADWNIVAPYVIREKSP